MKIFVTGGAGFIGSEFVRNTLSGQLDGFGVNPSKLIVYDALTYAGNIENLSLFKNDERLDFIQGDICDSDVWKNIPTNCDLLVNFAAESHVDRSIEGPSVFIKTNVLGTQNLLEGKKLPLYGDGKNIREWIHVSDHVRGIVHAYKFGKPGEIYNIAGDTELTNLDITKILLKEFNLDESRINFVQDRLGHDFRYSLDSSKISLIGFKTNVDFQKGIRSTINWYKENINWLRGNS